MKQNHKVKYLPVFKRILFLLIPLLYLAVTGCKDSGKNMAPDFQLVNLHSERVYLNQFAGNVVLLNFWSVHCVPCHAEMPLLDSVSRQLGPKNLTLLGVNTDPKEAGYLSEFLNGLSITYPILLDKDSRVQMLYDVKELPTSILIDKKGTIRERYVGYEDGDLDAVAKKIEELLSEGL